MRFAYRLYEKTGAGTDPETWQEVTPAALYALTIAPLGDSAAVVAAARLQREPTHVARGDWRDAYQSGRLLLDVVSGNCYLVLTVRESGKRRRGAAHAARVYMQVSRNGDRESNAL